MKSQTKQMNLKRKAATFAQADTRAGLLQLCNTVFPLAFLWVAAYQSLSLSIWLSLLFSVIGGGFVVRLFIIFHDCTHGSFFKHAKANRVLGTFLGIITHFPFEKWKRSHAMHHATSGNLDKRGTGDIWLLTIEEYEQASIWKKTAYRLYRNPLIMFGLGPLYLFLIENRLNKRGAKRKERLNTHVTNVAIVALYAVGIWLLGWEAFLLVQGPLMFIAGAAGIWLFYVQHQFEDSYFENEAEWDFVKAAVEGSSYYKLPKPLQWITGNIGFHHVHHLSPKVPNYNLEKTHQQVVPLQKATTITLATSLASLKFRLFDEKNKTFVSFGDFKKMRKVKLSANRSL
ncbi:fatty-acid desaturase [Niallia circulans]|uniref:Fatty acid desaturase n=1 Tax=Shouchella clausii TaxID=79880 RepID=A0A268RXC6_SHOCL|nr:fatty acid desaturase [Shouchella clausii]PAD44255.1 fatty acid desaturase [Bacillus sp. 7520-S]SPU21263.1 fatty-acid desaturase [Niallia circulans]MBU8596242.1 fatty acid desaturase [Shouchella clausii]MCY1103031.1 fatty acid desaturase [Shouchella clausii]MEB5479901.1 fatty acid desaturase [Shouchella clausii]